MVFCGDIWKTCDNVDFYQSPLSLEKNRVGNPLTFCILGYNLLQGTALPHKLSYDSWMPLFTCDMARHRPKQFLFFVS